MKNRPRNKTTAQRILLYQDCNGRIHGAKRTGVVHCSGMVKPNTSKQTRDVAYDMVIHS